MYNVLTDPMIRVRAGSETQLVNLPELYVALMGDLVESFPALRPHHQHAWHAFLVQLGFLAIRTDTSRDRVPETADEWAYLIRRLTPNHWDDEPWQLITDDRAAPAFMQPPMGNTDLRDEYKYEVMTPDDLDVLVTSKNHGMRSGVAANAKVDSWLFALVCLQTMSSRKGGPPSSDSHNISRMNRGYSNRPAFSLAPASRGRLAPSPGSHVREDIEVLLRNIPDTAKHLSLIHISEPTRPY